MHSEIAIQNNSSAIPRGVGLHETTKKFSPAASWLGVTQNLVAARISQYKELGNPDADSPDFFRPQLEALELIQTRFDEGDPATIQFLEDMEAQTIEASGGSEANYFLAHVKQLDFLAGMIEPFENSKTSSR